MILAILWLLLAVSLFVAITCSYFYWFSGNTAIWNMLGFYSGTIFSIVFFALIIIIKIFHFLT